MGRMRLTLRTIRQTCIPARSARRPALRASDQVNNQEQAEMSPEEKSKLQTYLRKTLGLADLEVKPMMRKDDMLEVYIGGEPMALLYKIIDEDDGEVSYEFRMAILDIDLEEL